MRRNPSRESIVAVTLLTLLIASLAGNAYAEDANSSIDADELARELTADGWVVYGTGQCYFCNKQKEEFGDAFANVTYTNCTEDLQACKNVRMYLFSWDDVTGEGSRLLEYLERNYHAGWVECAEISKSEDDKTVSISDENNSAEIMLDEGNGVAILQIGGKPHYLKVKRESGKLNLYAGLEGIPCWVSPNGTLHPGYYNLTRLSGILNDYRAAHPAPTPTPANAIGFESVSALFAVTIVVFLMRRR